MCTVQCSAHFFTYVDIESFSRVFTPPLHLQVRLGRIQAASEGSPAIAPRLEAVVMPLPTGPGTDGILGLDWLSGYDAVVFDWDQRPGSLTLHPKGSLDDVTWYGTTQPVNRSVLRIKHMSVVGVTLPPFCDWKPSLGRR